MFDNETFSWAKQTMVACVNDDPTVSSDCEELRYDSNTHTYQGCRSAHGITNK